LAIANRNPVLRYLDIEARLDHSKQPSDLVERARSKVLLHLKHDIRGKFDRIGDFLGERRSGE
jgi:hypothetical protein